jgi:cytochrome c biogenesis protein CcmG, thiol:disulfide interchange protein DsbE
MLHSPKFDDRHAEGRVATQRTRALRGRRAIIVAVAIAAASTLLVIAAVKVAFPAPSGIPSGQVAPDITGMTLDGTPFRLSDLRGRPVILNFWGPSCVPCRSEFPLFLSKLAQHSADGLAVVGVLMYDSPPAARAFITRFNATWPTVDDGNATIRTEYGVKFRPQTYFIDRTGVIRTIQYGEVVSADFERQYATIAR